ncbi:serine hydrolase domain-containing protein [Dermacoccaceae bacterium W4C1]
MSLPARQVLDAFVAAVDAEQLGAYGAHVRIGDDVAEHRWRSDDRVNIYSAAKGVCAIAAGIAVDEGLLTPETTVAQSFPGFALGDGTDRVTLMDLLTMSSGIDFTWFATHEVPWPDLAAHMLSLPAAAGRRFQYSDASTYVAMRMLGSLVGDVRDWLLPRLFEPLGIHNPQWHRCPGGWITAGSDLFLRTEELARIGLLLRDGGRWQGRQLVSPGWVRQMGQPQARTEWGGFYREYGIGLWMGPGECTRLDGAYGQYVVIDASHSAVFTVTAHEQEHDDRLASWAAAALRGEQVQPR